MAAIKHRHPEVLPGADPDSDCQGQPLETTGIDPTAAQPIPLPDASPEYGNVLEADEDEEETPSHVTWLNVPTPKPGADTIGLRAWQPLRGRWSVWLERVALLFERPINKLTSTQFNPLYHTGTIAFFLLVVVGLTGLYLFFFFQYGFDASYRAVSVMESQLIARIIRAGHRYASGALVIVTLLHAYRTLFLEKFRGPRWLAWVTGIILTAIIWIAGVTGYWLIWDERALLITETFRRGLERLTSWTPGFMVFLLGANATGRSWIFFLVLIALHIALFLVALGFFYLHIRRLKRPKWLPPLHWVVAISVVLLLGVLFFPVGMLPQANLSLLPQAITFDPIFLFFLPFPGATWLWIALFVTSLSLAALPWLSRGKSRNSPVTDKNQSGPATSDLRERTNGQYLPPPVRIIKDRCTGCTKCALDCPYGAIEMVERHDGRPHKYIALENVDRCVSCGICVGSCDALAVTLGDVMPETLWGLVSNRIGDQAIPWRESSEAAGPALDLPTPLTHERMKGAQVIYTCERHALHGARPFFEGSPATASGDGTVVIPLPCVGAAPPDLLSRTMDAGARSVRVVGCPPDDCAGREGNIWAAQRLARQRVPRLRRNYLDSPITAAWLPPDAFAEVFRQEIPPAESGQPDFQATRPMPSEFNWRKFIPALLILAAVLLVQILMTDLPLPPNPDRMAVVQLAAADMGAVMGNLTAVQATDDTYRLSLIINGSEAYTKTIPAGELLGMSIMDRLPFFYEMPIEPGEYVISLRLTGNTGTEYRLFDGPVAIRRGEVWRPPIESFRTPACRPVGFDACPE